MGLLGWLLGRSEAKKSDRIEAGDGFDASLADSILQGDGTALAKVTREDWSGLPKVLRTMATAEKTLIDRIGVGIMDPKLIRELDILGERQKVIYAKMGLSAVPALIRALGDTDHEVRREACRALCSIGSQVELPSEAIVAIAWMTSSEIRSDVESATIAMAGLAENKKDLISVVPRLLSLLRKRGLEFGPMAHAAITTLGKLPPPSKETLEVLSALTRHDHPQLAAEATDALTRLGHPRAP